MPDLHSFPCVISNATASHDDDLSQTAAPASSP
jgi:hypothetical protein